VVLPEESEKMVRALERAGGKVRYTLYPKAYHDSWTETYDSPALYDWLLSNRKVEN
jgi:acetyl esterase/lipase